MKHIFNCQSDYKKQKIRNKVIDPCYGVYHEDEIENEYLIGYSKDDKSSEYISSLEQIKLIDDNIDIKSVFDEDITSSCSDILNKCLLNNIVLNEQQKESLDVRISRFYGKRINSINDLLSAINTIFKLEKSDDISISRLSNNTARNFYSVLMQWIIEGKTVKEKALRITRYYNQKSDGELIYVGKRGEICAELIGEKLVICNSGYSFLRVDKSGRPIKLKRLWIINNHNIKKLYNICVIKVKVEEDFISYKLIPFIEAINDIDNTIIDEKLYNLIKYKSNDLFEIELIKEGFSIYLARALNDVNYKKYIKFTDLGVIIDDEILKYFVDNKIIYEELKKFLLCLLKKIIRYYCKLIKKIV